MANAQTNQRSSDRSVRLWPCAIIVILQLFVRFGVPLFMPGFEGFRIAFLGSLLGTVIFFVWWVFFSRVSLAERWTVLGTMALILAFVWTFNHSSMHIIWFLGYAVPITILAVLTWVMLSLGYSKKMRLVTMFLTILLSCGWWILLRTEGMTGDHVSRFVWRWSETHEERLLARGSDVPVGNLYDVEVDEAVDLVWPGFRGPERNGVVPHVKVATDWSQTPPIELWRRSIGPGWSSFAVRGDRLFTQEQRGEEEIVACYRVSTGEPVWKHHNQARFYESIAGPGPRGTPTLSGEQVVTLGATGILNFLEASSGELIWSRNVVEDTGKKAHIWGFAASPLVLGNNIIVGVSGKLVAYDRLTGELAWSGPDGGVSYSSPHPVVIDGVAQVVLMSSVGTTAFLPDSGTLLWKSPWKGQPMVQPAVISDHGLLTNAGEGFGVRRLAVSMGSQGWHAEVKWTSKRLRPNFNDLVIHKGHVYGFDGHILACLDLDDGKRKWKGGRYGQGQLLLLAEQDVLLILSERGDLALAKAMPEGFEELSRVSAIEGKTWNHPVLVGDLLLIRNGEEMAAFRLPLAGGE